MNASELGTSKPSAVNPLGSQQQSQRRDVPPPPRRDPLTSALNPVHPSRGGHPLSVTSVSSGGDSSVPTQPMALGGLLGEPSPSGHGLGSHRQHSAASTFRPSHRGEAGVGGSMDQPQATSFLGTFASQMSTPAPLGAVPPFSVAETRPTDVISSAEAVVKVRTLRQANNIPQSTGVMSPFLKAVWSVVKFVFRDILSLRLGFLKIQYPFSKHKLANTFVIGLRLVVSAAIATGIITSIVLTAGTTLSIAGGIFLGVLGAAFVAGWAFEARSYTKYNQRIKADQIKNQNFPNDPAHKKLNEYRQKLAQLEADRTQYASTVKESENPWRAAMSRSDFEAKREELEIELLKAYDEIQQSVVTFTASQIRMPYDKSNISAYVGQITSLLNNNSQNQKIANSITGFISALQRCFTLAEAKKSGHGTDKDVVEIETLTNSEGLVALLNRFMANPKDVTKEITAVADRLNRLS